MDFMSFIPEARTTYILMRTPTVMYQSRTAATFKQILNDATNPQSSILARRPFYVWWFMSQMAMCVGLKLSFLSKSWLTMPLD
jgi:hypothetical protein